MNYLNSFLMSFASLNREVVLERFASLYESFAPLTNIINQHFVEWFSGSSLSTLWTFTNITGTNSGAMNDGADGGYRITTANTTEARAKITFNAKRQYSNTGSICIANVRRNSANGLAWVGLAAGSGDAGSSAANYATYRDYANDTFKRISTSNGSSITQTDSDVAVDTSLTNAKIELGSTPNAKLYINGVIKVTTTSTLPNAKCEPIFGVFRVTGSSAVTGDITFLEAYGTPVSISSSLYERLSALTQVMGQRVVEWFGGSDIDTARWDKYDYIGTPTYSVIDGVDDGFRISTGTTLNAVGVLNFNDKRQYIHNNSVILGVIRANSTTTTNVQLMLSSLRAYANHRISIGVGTGASSNFKITTFNTSGSTSASDIAIDTNWHNHKALAGSSDIKYYIDGVLKVTKSTNRPTSSLQPMFIVQQIGAVGGRTGDVRYLEAYNKLTTETDYPSVYEALQALTTLAKTRFVEWFSSSVINPKWTQNNVNGTGTFSISDEVDGGASVATGTTSGNRNSITFNNINQYSHQNCTFIAVVKSNSTSLSETLTGFCNIADGASASQHSVQVMNHYLIANYTAQTSDGTTASNTQSDIPIDTSWHLFKGVLDSTDFRLYIDGVLKVTKTTNRPTTRMQPFFYQRTYTGATKEGRIRYYESYAI